MLNSTKQKLEAFTVKLTTEKYLLCHHITSNI